MASTSSNNSIIQSSSNTFSSLVTSPRKNYYDVFVSFRGKDTRYNFTDHLFAAFQRKGIFAFRDDTNLHKGESIAPELLRAIQDSKVFIVVFSENYASSAWCLGELESILECVQLYGKRVLPVFYDVDPSEVRYQKGTYSEAFVKHEQIFHRDSKTMSRWREALTQVANLSGWNLRDKPEYAEIEKIAQEVINILDYKFSSVPKDLVGMNSPIEELENHLLLDSVNDVQIVGICGMGGIGKTTLATALYKKISHQFSVCCFIDDLSKIYRHDGPISAQKQILLQTFGEEHLQTCNLYDASNLTRSRLHRVKALIILDNVDHIEQLEKLAVSREWLGAGSRIIITSRDEHILKEYGVDVVYKVPLLNHSDSLQLFCRKAFKLDHTLSGYDKLAFDIIRYADGLPLAVEVLGSFLFDRNISEWKSALARLREIPNKDIMDVLQLSFDGLGEMEMEIFLHIACFFNWYEEKYVKNILHYCGFHADIGLRILIDKSLISISDYNYIIMHDLLEELGRKIVQDSREESRKWSRLWLHEQFYNVMLENMEKKVEAIVIYRDKKETKKLVMAETLSKMVHLRLLILSEVIFTGNLSCLSNELRYVVWERYPFKYLPSSFQPNQLVELILKHSNIKQLWKDKKCMFLPNLRVLEMSHSKNLRKMLDFGEIPNLEKLKLEGCEKLVKLDPSILLLRKIVNLNLKDCKNLTSIPNNIFGMSSLEYLNLSGCPKLFKNPRQLKMFDSSESSSLSQSTPSAILANCLLHSLLSLSSLDISFCGLSQLPDAIGCLCRLENINLGGNNFVTLPSLRELSKLTYLNLEHCKLLESLPQLPSSSAMEHLFDTKGYRKTKGLVIFNCPKLSERENCLNITFSWMIQFIQANPQFSTTSFDGIIDIVIPGSEMPIWFNNQSQSGSIRIDPSPIMHYNIDHFIGICCCAVFSVAPIDPTTTLYVKRPKVMLSISENSIFPIFGKWYDGWIDKIPVVLERDFIAVKSHHMWLMYFPLEVFFDILKRIDKTLVHLDHVKLKFLTKNGTGLDLEVQSCGYHWISKQDHASVQKFISSELQVNEAQTQSLI